MWVLLLKAFAQGALLRLLVECTSWLLLLCTCYIFIDVELWM
jgi:hypothetical protein